MNQSSMIDIPAVTTQSSSQSSTNSSDIKKYAGKPLTSSELNHRTSYTKNYMLPFKKLDGYFEIGDVVNCRLDYLPTDGILLGKITDIGFGRDFMSSFCKITVDSIIHTTSNGLAFTHFAIFIRERARIDIRSIDLCHITDEQFQFASDRGVQYLSLINGVHHMIFDGIAYQPVGYRPHEYTKKMIKSDVIIDMSGLIDLDSDTWKLVTEFTDYISIDPTLFNVDRTLHYLLPPTVFGIELTTKKFTAFPIKNLTSYKYNSSVFSQLILDDNYKQILRSIIKTANQVQFTDIVKNKSGGFVFLLHGAPGVGKTLTAEAIAEELNKPLYSVSAGQLGVVVEDLERNLTTILRSAQRWQAVVLLDEADVFLERRSTNEIERNAMVSVFLRMLEYYNGILILTSNKVNTIDAAFNSRIGLAIHYPFMDNDTRKKIWLMLLTESNVDTTHINCDELSTLPINGRQIKNVIRIAHAMSLTLNEPITEKMLLNIVNTTVSFEHDIIDSKDYA